MLEMKRVKLTYFPLYVTLKSQMTNLSEKEERNTGFTLNWFLKDSNGSKVTEKLPARQEDWKEEIPTPKYEQPLLSEMIKLTRKLRLQNMTEKEIWEDVIKRKMGNVKILEKEGMCSMGQVKTQNLKEAFSKLVTYKITDEQEGFASEEDVRSGYKLFHAIAHCPTMTIKLFRFINQLLSNESSRTIIQTFGNLFHSEADKMSFTLAKQLYHQLSFTLNLQYGNVLLAMLTNGQLQTLTRNDWPFFANNSDLVEKCLQESHCDGIEDIFQRLGI